MTAPIQSLLDTVAEGVLSIVEILVIIYCPEIFVLPANVVHPKSLCSVQPPSTVPPKGSKLLVKQEKTEALPFSKDANVTKAVVLAVALSVTDWTTASAPLFVIGTPVISQIVKSIMFGKFPKAKAI